MSWSEESEVKGGGTKSENTDQATEFVKVQSRNSQCYNPSLPLFVPHMKTGMPAVFLCMLQFSATIPAGSIGHFYFNMATTIIR